MFVKHATNVFHPPIFWIYTYLKHMIPTLQPWQKENPWYAFYKKDFFFYFAWAFFYSSSALLKVAI